MKKRLFIYIIIITLMFISNYTVVKAKNNYLYDVLKDEAESGGLAKEYTGEHHDSFTEEPSKKIYHWYAKNDTEGNQVLEKNNVIFADHCWQMIRTTDTGGVKMIYNGIEKNGQCKNNRSNQPLYTLYSDVYYGSNYYYGTDYSYDSTSGLFKLSGSIFSKNLNSNTIESLIGKYSCRSTNKEETCSRLFYIDSYKGGSYANSIEIESSNLISQISQGISYDNPSSLSSVGYMYNGVNTAKSKQVFYNEILYSTDSSLNETYWYGDSVAWGSPVENKWNLINAFQVPKSEFSTLVGKYTFSSKNEDYSSDKVRYITKVDGYNYYYILLSGNNDLNSYNYNYSYADEYIINEDGTFSLVNPLSFDRVTWGDYYNKIKNKYICKNAINNVCEELWYVVDTNIKSFKYSSIYKYATSFKYEDGKYKLDNQSFYLNNLNDNGNISNLNKAHYTCWNINGECSEISYIFYLSSNSSYGEGRRPFYVTLEYGQSIENYLKDLISNETVNKKDSKIKKIIEIWYKKNLLQGDDFIEDTIFCNDRSIKELNGWDPNGGDVQKSLIFAGYDLKNDLSCINITDQFSVSNNKAELKYKIGLMTANEMYILNNRFLRKSSAAYRVMTPYYYSPNWPNGRFIEKDGNMTSLNINGYIGNGLGIRPAISLKSSARVISGDGSTGNPYQLSFNPVYRYSVNVQVVNETKDLDINIEDMSQVEEGEEVTFKVTPIDGYKLSSIKILDSANNEVTFTETGVENQYKFTMPASNVTIIPSYKKNKFNISVTVKNEEDDFDINVEDMTSVLVGEEVTFKATPITGYKVNSIQILDSNNNEVTFTSTSNENEYTFVMPESDITIIPSYERVSNSIEVEENTHTKELIIEVDDVTAVVYEDEVKFTIIPEKGYEVDSIDIKDQDNNSIDYNKTDNDNEYSFIMPPSNVTIKPTYKKVSNSVNVDDNKNTKEFIIEVNDSKAVVYEDTVKFTIIPEDGYEIEDIEIIDKNNNKIEYKKTNKDNEYSFIMSDTDVIIKPIYRKLPIKENNNIINPLTNNNLTKILLIVILFFTTGLFLYRKKGLSL